MKTFLRYTRKFADGRALEVQERFGISATKLRYIVNSDGTGLSRESEEIYRYVYDNRVSLLTTMYRDVFFEKDRLYRKEGEV